MARGFKSTPQGYSAQFSEEEAELLARLFSDVAFALEPEADEEADPLGALVGINENPQIPTDPALARILPVASDDPEVAKEFRRYTDITLRKQKIGNLKMAAFDVEAHNVVLTNEHAQSWAAALNDVRLTLGARLGIASEDDAQAISDHHSPAQVETVEEYMALVYNFVTWLQDSLMEAMLSDLDY